MARLLPSDTFGLSLDDIDEVYADVTEQTSVARARLWYSSQLLLAFPAFLNHGFYWTHLMLRSYFKLAFRHMTKAKFTSSLHIAGLALSIACAIVMFLFIDLQFNMDTFHENGERIYLVEHKVQAGHQEQTWGTSPTPLGPALIRDVPSVLHAVRIDRVPGTMKHDDYVFTEPLMFADPAFFEVFTFPLRYGLPNAFHNPNHVILSDAVAEKYFGARNPIGETITLNLNDQHTTAFTVGGVAEPFPYNASFRFEILVPYEHLTALGKPLEDWGEISRATFVELDTPASAERVTQALASYVPRQNIADSERPMQDLLLQPLRDVPTKGFHVRGTLVAKVHPATAPFFGLLAVLVLALACFNYINLALAAATRRMKEIGIRKVVGGSRGQLIGQFLGENLLMSLFAMVAGVGLAELVFIPGINELLLGRIGFDLDYAANIDVWVFLALVLLFTGFAAGLYPALYVSSFHPTAILKGVLSVRSKLRLTRVLLTLQFTVSFILLALGFANLQNTERQRQQDWGYNQAQTLVIPFKNAENVAPFRDAIAQHPAIEHVAGATQHIGRGTGNLSFQVGEGTYEAVHFDVAPTYLETMALRLITGRSFEEDRTNDTEAVVVNETLLGTLGWSADSLDTLGRTLDMGGITYTIIGIVEDFHYAPFMRTIEPTILRLADADDLNYVVIRTREGQATQVADFVQATWRTQYPDRPYEGFFQDTVFDSYFTGMERGASFLTFVSIIALLTSLMGLFGVVPLTLTGRMKEIGIRKMLGARVWEVVLMIQRDFAPVLVAALILGGGTSVFGVNAIFTALSPYNEPASSGPFVLAGFIVLGSAALISLIWTYRRALTNPVDVLRHASE